MSVTGPLVAARNTIPESLRYLLALIVLVVGVTVGIYLMTEYPPAFPMTALENASSGGERFKIRILYNIKWYSRLIVPFGTSIGLAYALIK